MLMIPNPDDFPILYLLNIYQLKKYSWITYIVWNRLIDKNIV